MSKIGIFDSGIGGFTTLREILKINSGHTYLYWMDDAHCPYGTKRVKNIKRLVFDACLNMEKAGCDMIVLACNTATAAAVDGLRKHFKLPIIGTEPALKNAFGRTVLLATPAAIRQKRIKRLYRNIDTLVLADCTGLADLIQKHADAPQKALPQVRKILKGQTPDSIVLGCTHYVFLRDEIAESFPYTRILDGNAGVAKRVAELAQTQAERGKEAVQKCSTVQLKCTSGNENKYQTMLQQYLGALADVRV